MITKKYLISLKCGEDGKVSMKRYNKNFNVFELLGILEIVKQEILLQMSGNLNNRVTTLKRSILKSESEQNNCI